MGHPLCDRYPDLEFNDPKSIHEPRRLLLLPGSRVKELSRHLPAMVEAAKAVKAEPLIVLSDESLAAQARLLAPEVADWDIQIGELEKALSRADVAIASSGTVTLECAWFRVPTVVLYKTSWITYLLGRLFIRVKHIAMPNVMAEREVFPEFIQSAATGENLAHEANGFLNDSHRRVELREQLDVIADSLGGKGAANRAARSIIRLLDN